MPRILPLACTAMLVCISAIVPVAGNQDANESGTVELASHEAESSSARIEPARRGEEEGIAVIFTGTHDLHYYAKPETATAPGFELQVSAGSDGLDFGEPVFPKWEIFNDPTGARVEVYAGDFTVFVPITGLKEGATGNQHDVEVTISGQACTSKICLMPFEKTLQTRIDWNNRDSWRQITLEDSKESRPAAETSQVPDYSVWLALAIAFVAGLALNIMPCVWPVLPVIIMRVVEQAKQGRRQSLTMGLVFCLGILLFFAALATANIILQSFYDRSLSWGDHLRNPMVVTALSLLMVILALFMFGVFTFAVPSSIASKSGSGKGYTGSVGMGFLAAILSTPCSFGPLTLAFVWAQGQSLAMGTLVIMVIGLGMAAPYAVLTSMPGWLEKLPRGGRWLELFKQSLGFVLLIIAAKLFKAVPDENKIDLLYFAVILSFGIWVWGTWTPYGTRLSRKLLVRGFAVLLVISSFWFFFKPEPIDWRQYDRDLIQSAKSEDTPVLMKFTADWCTNCEVVDKFVYERKDIARLIEEKGILAIKGDTTRSTQPARVDLENVYNEPGVPVTILWLPDKDELVRFREIFFGDKLKELLEALPDEDKTKAAEGAA